MQDAAAQATGTLPKAGQVPCLQAGRVQLAAGCQPGSPAASGVNAAAAPASSSPAAPPHHPLPSPQCVEQLEIVRTACTELHGCSAFTKLLQAVLELGNHLNQVGVVGVAVNRGSRRRAACAARQLGSRQGSCRCKKSWESGRLRTVQAWDAAHCRYC